MLLDIKSLHKSIGPKVLFSNLSFSIDDNEKVAMVGRNGVGKTTLFKVLTGEDNDYIGEISLKKSTRMVMTMQEHAILDSITPLSYILDYVPNYHKLKEIIDAYPSKMGSDVGLISEYSEAIDKFGFLGYFDIEDRIIDTLEGLMIPFDKALGNMSKLSGGEKRFVELAKVMYSEADLALIDEPTNHMDYVGKKVFIEWLESFPKAVIVISHDRDVLDKVNRIVEIKDKKVYSFKGNYKAYLQQNSLKTVTQVKTYEDSLKLLEKLHEQMIAARVRKLRAKSDAGRKNAKVMEDRFAKEYERLKESIDKPSFWIDGETKEKMDESIQKSYDRYKDKNITIQLKSDEEIRSELLRVSDLSLGYSHQLFKNISFSVFHGDRVMLKGRNGVGKSTIVKAIISMYCKSNLESRVFEGEINLMPKIRLGNYEQEISEKYLGMTLFDGIMDIYANLRIIKSNQEIYNEMAAYLFNPPVDRDIKISNLSGGQKARFQIMKMLAGKPNLLILDEPTNHLDLPSIEELEKVMFGYKGGIIYITHDSYFMRHIGGKIIPVGLQ